MCSFDICPGVFFFLMYFTMFNCDVVVYKTLGDACREFCLSKGEAVLPGGDPVTRAREAGRRWVHAGGEFIAGVAPYVRSWQPEAAGGAAMADAVDDYYSQ